MKAADLNKLPDAQLLGELKTFQTTVAASPTDYGLTAADATAMDTLLGTFNGKIGVVATARAAAVSATQDKDATRTQVVELARTQFKVARAFPGITDATLAAANLDPYDTTGTASTAPASAPVGIVDLAKLQHTIRFRDASTPDSDKKPDGVLGCEIWVKIDGAPPLDEKECSFVALDTATPYVINFSGADGGKTAHYLLRWVSTRGEKGIWSEVVSATIPA